jgi:hypothetical protein
MLHVHYFLDSHPFNIITPYIYIKYIDRILLSYIGVGTSKLDWNTRLLSYMRFVLATAPSGLLHL